MGQPELKKKIARFFAYYVIRPLYIIIGLYMLYALGYLLVDILQRRFGLFR